jgi:hypothetical protein
MIDLKQPRREKGTGMKYGSARRPSRRAVKIGIAAVAAIAAGSAIFASQAGAATFRVHKQNQRSFDTNVMLKVPQGTTCAYVENFFNNGLREPLRKTGTQVYDFKALHWDSSAWNSIGTHLSGLNVLRVHALKTPYPCGAFTNSLPGDEGHDFPVPSSGGPWPDAWLDASSIPLHVDHF